MLISLLSSVGIGALNSYLGYLEKKADSATEQERIRYNLKIEEVKERIEQKKEQRLLQEKENEFFIFRFSKGLLFLSTSVYLSATLWLSTLGITPDVYRVLEIPENMQYIPYAIVAYWTLKEIRR